MANTSRMEATITTPSTKTRSQWIRAFNRRPPPFLISCGPIVTARGGIAAGTNKNVTDRIYSGSVNMASYVVDSCAAGHPDQPGWGAEGRVGDQRDSGGPTHEHPGVASGPLS